MNGSVEDEFERQGAVDRRDDRLKRSDADARVSVDVADEPPFVRAIGPCKASRDRATDEWLAPVGHHMHVEGERFTGMNRRR